MLAGGALTLLCGDIFALPGDGSFDRVWDRASLVALDPAQRQLYAARITAAMAPRGVMLLQVLHREKGAPLALQGGPPFSVTEADVKALYGRRVLRWLSVKRALKARGLNLTALTTARLTSRSWSPPTRWRPTPGSRPPG